jgi:site-specific DNA recombinase
MPSLIPPPSTLPPQSTVWAYLRDSGGDGQDRSVQRQLNTLQEYANQHNLILARVYKDIAKTGTTTAGREDFQKMIAATKQEENRPDGLLLWNYARFARNLDDATYHKALLRKRGIIIHSITDPIPEGPYARFVETLIDIADEEKSRQTSIDVKASLQALVQQGAVPGTPPVGFLRTPIQTINPRTGKPRINHRWDPDPEYTHRIRKAFTMLASRATLAQIIKETTLYKTANSYNRFFQNKLYIGILEYSEITVPNYCQPTISNELWDDVQRIIKARAQARHLRSGKTHPRTKSGSYLLTGLLRCKKCGAALTGMSSKQRNGTIYRRYQCSTAKKTRSTECTQKPIPAAHLEETVIKSIKEFVSDPINLAEMLSDAKKDHNSLQTTVDAERKVLNSQLGAIKRQIANTTNAIAESGHSQALLTKLQHLELDQADQISKLAQLKESETTPIPSYTPGQIKKRSAMLAKRLETKDPAKLRQHLLSLADQIIVDRNDQELDILITFYQPKQTAKPPPNDEEDHPEYPGIITVSLFPPTVGAQAKSRYFSGFFDSFSYPKKLCQ